MARGGRKPGEWIEGLSGSALREYRAKHGVSRMTMGKILGVSSTTIQNWETAVVIPSRVNQVKLGQVIKAGPPPVEFASRRSVSLSPPANQDVFEATGKITTAYVALMANNGCQLTPERLCEVIRSVRSALT